jgi:DivIVA domain-containing protein
MPILPEEIATATFSRARQGYNQAEVETFLQEIAADYAAALEKMVLGQEETPELDVGQEVNSILRTARESASGLLQRAQEDAEAIQKAATEKAQGIETQASEARVRAFEQASQEANRIKAQADEYSFELRNRSEAQTRETVERAEQRARQLYAYNQELSQHLEEIERLVGALRGEIDSPRKAWPEQPADEPIRMGEPPSSSDREERMIGDMDEDLEKEGV